MHQSYKRNFLRYLFSFFLSCPRQDKDYRVEVLDVQPGEGVKYPKLHKWLKITMFSFVESEDIYGSVNFSCASCETHKSSCETLNRVLRAERDHNLID